MACLRTFLRLHPLPVDEARPGDSARVETEVVLDGLECWRWAFVGPDFAFDCFVC